ncbi:hypothetical protein EVAR_83404_1 [Eumeta japonica]|uniref:Uncharacterized protein n=1 Tax=Eumeta variegata TaxID=151549 RepID=A0A4C1TYF2_EUMVA|nr:hypothetical protein EVAR_83404_1 [Eumeta japonica]
MLSKQHNLVDRSKTRRTHNESRVSLFVKESKNSIAQKTASEWEAQANARRRINTRQFLITHDKRRTTADTPRGRVVSCARRHANVVHAK